jgi:hypothetical protein
MTTDHIAIVTPNTSADQARNRPASLPRRQRVASAIASAVISGVMLGGVVFGMTDSHEGPLVAAGTVATPASAA